MSKRKLSDLHDFDPRDRTLGRLNAQFDNGVAALSQALKTARVFERQKLGRREKTARSENKRDVLARLEEEIKVIKALDFQATAQKYLFKQLLKTKRIAEAPAFVQFKERKNISTEGPRSTAEANVTARLYKSNPVKNVFPGIIDGIRKIFGLEDTRAALKDAKDAKKGASEAKNESESKNQSKDVAPEVGAPSGSESDANPTADGEEQSDIEMDYDSEAFAGFDDRLAPGSDSESGSGEEDEDEDEDEDDADDNRHARPSYSDISISRSPSPELDSRPSKKSKKDAAAAAAPTSTTFLPSLTMGGYFSGSESEAEEIESTEPPRRKNRMGQQARRALWEKKYGSGANHLKKQNDNDRRSRDSGWDVRRGATDGSEGPRGRRPAARRPDTFQGRDKFSGDRPQRGPAGAPKKNPSDDKPIHPSWEAARKAKEQKSMASFQGKKVVFD